MKNILISGLGGSLFPYLHSVLKTKYNLFYVDSNPTLSKIYPDLHFYHAPRVEDSDYFPFIESLVRKHHIYAYIPLIDEEILPALSYCNDKLSDLIISVPHANFCSLCLDKHRLMQSLHDTGISSLLSILAHEVQPSHSFPIFVKPRVGRGSRGISKISSYEQLDGYLKLNNALSPDQIMVQENVEGQEYTVGVLINKENQLLSICSKKVIEKKGITISAVTETNPLINSVVQEIVDQYAPCGPMNVQLFVTPDQEIKVFEINPRFSTTTVLSLRAGVDKISLYLENLHNQLPDGPVFPKEDIFLHRRWESIFYE